MSEQTAETKRPTIEVENLVFEYPTKRALHGVSLTVNEGAIVALVGPNGAGKTTLMRCIVALEKPFSGRVRVGGLDTVQHPRKVHELLGYLPDFFGLYDELSVGRCLMYAARAHGLSASEAEPAARKAAERVTLIKRWDEKAGALSRGLRQRLAIGQAIVHEPRVLLLDEPASGLDPKARMDLSELLKSLQGQGITQVISSHILSELEDYCTEMVIIDEGRLKGDRAITQAVSKLRIRIELARAILDFPGWLEKRSDIEIVSVDAEGALITMSDNASARALLIRAMVEAGFPISAVNVAKQSLSDAYFEHVTGGGEQ